MNPCLLLHLGSDFGLPPWGKAPGAGSFEVRRDSEDLGYPRGKHFALGTLGYKPPWAGGQRSSTMDYLVGIFLLLCGVALPGRVAPQHTKENVPRLKLSYKGKFCNQSHHQHIQVFLPFQILITCLTPIYIRNFDFFAIIYIWIPSLSLCCFILTVSLTLACDLVSFFPNRLFPLLKVHVLALLYNFSSCTVL